jgi:hypothetical protein
MYVSPAIHDGEASFAKRYAIGLLRRA